jgi:hypothetical protein
MSAIPLEQPVVIPEEAVRNIRLSLAARYPGLVAFFEEAAAREQCTVFWAA